MASRPEFTSTDITHLASESGHRGFSNPSFAIRKAVARGLLSEVDGGKRRITAEGEQQVQLLPR